MKIRPWIVQKYGGTSIGKLLNTITGSIIPEHLQLYNVAVVCSARSGTSKSKGTTSLLLDAIRLATSSETSTVELDQVINVIKEEHLAAAHIAVREREQQKDRVIFEKLQQDIEKECEHLRSFLKAAWTIGEISERTQDRVLAVGEKLSCRILVASLMTNGVDAEVVLLDDIVQQTYGPSHRDQIKAYRRHPSEFLSALSTTIQIKISKCISKVPVITGFFGAMPESLLHSVGRGYSDLCAALCAAALSAEELQIWKEVDGIFTADPGKMKSARLLATVTSEEAAELTYYGSEVIHPLTIEQISNASISLRLKNVKNPLGAGTIIYPSSSSPGASPAPSSQHLPLSAAELTLHGRESANAKSVFMASNGYYGSTQYRRSPTAVTIKEAITVFNIRSNGRAKPQMFLAQIAERLARHDLTIDLISSSQQMISLAASSSNDGTGIDEAAVELEEIGVVSLARHMSIVSVVGHKMRNMVGVAGEIFSSLASARINIYLISQGASEINISFVVKAQEALLAMEVVHTNVMRIPLHSEQENNFIKGPWLY